MGFPSTILKFVVVILISTLIIPILSKADKLKACRAICGNWLKGAESSSEYLTPKQQNSIQSSGPLADNSNEDRSVNDNFHGRNFRTPGLYQKPCWQGFSGLLGDDHWIDYLDRSPYNSNKQYLMAADFLGARYLGIYHSENQQIYPINDGGGDWTFDRKYKTKVLGSIGGSLDWYDTDTDELRRTGPRNTALIVRRIQYQDPPEIADIYICRVRPSLYYHFGILSSRKSFWACQLGGGDDTGGKHFTEFSILINRHQEERGVVENCEELKIIVKFLLNMKNIFCIYSN